MPKQKRELAGAPLRFGMAFALILAAEPIRSVSPLTAFWTTPCILFASVLIAWGAESAQFFVAQGFALAILAWLQTLPEFAVEAVLAWRQQEELLLANLTGALRLLMGLAWPVIYATAAFTHRRRTGAPLRRIQLEREHSVEVIGLMPPMLYNAFIWWKGRLEIYDGVILFLFYAAYLIVLTRLPPEEQEQIEELERIPRAIARARPAVRNLAILSCFVAGGALIYFTAEPFLGSLIALATTVGVPSFIVVGWLAPVVSEFPELASTFYFARQEGKAPMALMNIISSNINQWTLLVGMLPIVFSLSTGHISVIHFDPQQRAELMLTLGQSFVGLIFLLNMRLEWWEATLLLILYALQAIFADTTSPNPTMHWIATRIRLSLTWVYLVWGCGQLVITIVRSKQIPAVTNIRHVFAKSVR